MLPPFISSIDITYLKHLSVHSLLSMPAGPTPLARSHSIMLMVSLRLPPVHPHQSHYSHLSQNVHHIQPSFIKPMVCLTELLCVDVNCSHRWLYSQHKPLAPIYDPYDSWGTWDKISGPPPNVCPYMLSGSIMDATTPLRP